MTHTQLIRGAVGLVILVASWSAGTKALATMGAATPPQRWAPATPGCPQPRAAARGAAAPAAVHKPKPCTATNTSPNTALPLALGRATRGVVCQQDKTTSYYWKISGRFAPRDWLRLRVMFEEGANAQDVDFAPMVKSPGGALVPIGAAGSCLHDAGENEDCGGIIMLATRDVYVDARPVTGHGETFQLRLDLTRAQ